jgi:16S rRNA (cytosine967-C5)-methyltransferase
MRGGAYSNLVVRSETESLESSDQRLAQRLAYGVLRRLLRIDRTLATVVDRPLETVQASTLDVLRVGAFELLFGAGAVHAAVDLAVEAARVLSGERAVGFVNGVLRAVARRGEAALPSGAAGAALRLGQPRWIYDRLVRQWDTAEAHAFLEASQQAAPVTVRRRPGGRIPEGAVAHPEIRDAFALAEGSEVGPERDVMVQDPASVAVVQALDPGPGEYILDLAAAPGGKTAAIADGLGASGFLTAADIHGRRARRARDRLAALGLAIAWIVADGRSPPFRRASFDRVLVDAPCSGLGTLRRRPEIRYRLTESEVTRLAGLQGRLLAQALELVKPGGAVVYAVCTVLAPETVDIVAPYAAEPPSEIPGRRWGKGVLLGPDLTGTDGMFISRVKRERTVQSPQ